MILNHGTNRTEIQFPNLSIFLSYSTPVAIHDLILRKVWVTETKYSNTTSRHINKWIDLLVSERGFPYISTSPESYGKMKQEAIQHTWNSYVMSGNEPRAITASGSIHLEDKSKSGMESRIHGILDE